MHHFLVIARARAFLLDSVRARIGASVCVRTGVCLLQMMRPARNV